jgi:hypothetical protein
MQTQRAFSFVRQPENFLKQLSQINPDTKKLLHWNSRRVGQFIRQRN